MLREFITYYLFHNESTVLPLLMMYMLSGTGAGLLFVAFERIANFLFGKDDVNSVEYVPNFLKFTTFWALWLTFETMEYVCKKWFQKGYLIASTLNEGLSDWMLRG